MFVKKPSIAFAKPRMSYLQAKPLVTFDACLAKDALKECDRNVSAVWIR